MDRPLARLIADQPQRLSSTEYEVMQHIDPPYMTAAELREKADVEAQHAPEAMLQRLCLLAAYEIERLTEIVDTTTARG